MAESGIEEAKRMGAGPQVLEQRVASMVKWRRKLQEELAATGAGLTSVESDETSFRRDIIEMRQTLLSRVDALRATNEQVQRNRRRHSYRLIDEETKVYQQNYTICLAVRDDLQRNDCVQLLRELGFSVADEEDRCVIQFTL